MALAFNTSMAYDDPERGPLAGACICRVGRVEHLLRLSIHHSLADHWCWILFERDLAAMYASAADGVATSTAVRSAGAPESSLS